MIARRTFIAGSIAAIALPVFAKSSALPPPKVGAIRWPGPGYELHGYMAVPGSAHGPQPAVLVVPDGGEPDPFTLGLADALARAGFVTCVPRGLAGMDEATATLRWLATNRYATGKVGAVGIGGGIGLVEQIAASPDAQLSCGVLFGREIQAPAGGVPLLALPPFAATTDRTAYAASWDEAVAFLGDHLDLPGKRRKS